MADWLQKVEFHRPSSAAPPPRRDRRHWRWIAAVLVIAIIAVAMFRQPLATLIWPDTRVQQLLDEAELALREGRLSAADGTGARQRFEAAQALDADRDEASAGLMRVAAAALMQARSHSLADRFDEARAALALARELQVPRAQADAVGNELRLREAEHAGVDVLLRQASAALAAGQPEAALPLYRKVLALLPNNTLALEGREDALSERLQQARQALAKGDLAGSAALIAQVREYDGGHVDLPAAQAELARAAEVRRARADADLRRERLDEAAAGYRAVLAAVAGDAAAGQGLQRTAAAYAQRAGAAAADFDFVDAEALLRKARELAPGAPDVQQAEVQEAEQALARARQSRSRLPSALPPQERDRRVQSLLTAMAEAEARADWLDPPGESAYDRLRAAQALAPEDAAVKRAAARFLPATQACFEDELRGNRIRRARGCYDAWQTIAPRDARLGDARRRLAQKWVAVGGERLGAGDVAFAAQALQEARQLDAQAPGLAEFEVRVRTAQSGGIRPLE